MFLGALIEYRLCLCVRRGGGDYVHVAKFMGEGGGIMSTYTNLSREGG